MTTTEQERESKVRVGINDVGETPGEAYAVSFEGADHMTMNASHLSQRAILFFDDFQDLIALRDRLNAALRERGLS